MNQADIRKLIPVLRITLNRRRKLKTPQGPEGRLYKLRSTVTDLIRDERIELNYPRADEARGYAERLISEAIRHGDCHSPTMELATYWLKEPNLVHKLFKVLVPRFQDYDRSYTVMHKAPNIYPGRFTDRAVLELRGNPFPPVVPRQGPTHNWIHNILLEEACREFLEKPEESQESENSESSHVEVASKDQ